MGVWWQSGCNCSWVQYWGLKMWVLPLCVVCVVGTQVHDQPRLQEEEGYFFQVMFG